MGLQNESMLSYLEDNQRFADLFNQLYFKGKQIVDADGLEEASETYRGKPGEKDSGRIRDIKKRLKSGRDEGTGCGEPKRDKLHHALAGHGLRLPGIRPADQGGPEGQ